MRRTLGCATALILAGAAPLQARPADRAAAIIGAFHDATGAAAWDRLGGCDEEGTQSDGAATYRTSFSLRHAGIRLENRRGDGTVRISGFNGRTSWHVDPDGTVHVSQDAAAIREAALTDYLSANRFFFPRRFPATARWLRAEAIDGHTFDVIEIAPAAALPVDYWFDRATHLLDRIVDRRDPAAPVVVRARDYRRVGPVRVAFALEVIGPGGIVVDRGHISSFRCSLLEPDRTRFDPPAAR